MNSVYNLTLKLISYKIENLQNATGLFPPILYDYNLTKPKIT